MDAKNKKEAMKRWLVKWLWKWKKLCERMLNIWNNGITYLEVKNLLKIINCITLPFEYCVSIRMPIWLSQRKLSVAFEGQNL